jgi:SAM-dependent methyltransferase
MRHLSGRTVYVATKREVRPTTRGTFGQMLKYLIDHNIRPNDSDEREPWTYDRLAEKLGLESRAQPGRWVSDNGLPPENRFDRMLDLFFGKSPKHNTELRDIFIRKYRRAKESERRYGNSALFAQSTTLLFWSALEEKFDANFETDSFDVKAKTVAETAWLLETRFAHLDKGRILQAARDAREHAFDVKYGDLQIEDDERYNLGIESWTTEFTDLLKNYGVDFGSKLVNVGLGPGLEGRGIYDQFPEFIGVDLSRSALEAAKMVFPNLTPAPGDAENLPRAADGSNVYISLKTFSSSFFDIDRSVRSCARCLRPNGIAVISVPRGYYKEGRLIPGLSPTNYDLALAIDGQFYGVPERLLPLRLVNDISGSLYRWLFGDIQVHTGRHEFYVFARKL